MKELRAIEICMESEKGDPILSFLALASKVEYIWLLNMI